MFESIFKGLPVPLRSTLERQLEALIMNLTEEKVADVKALINLAQGLRTELNKSKPKG